MAEGIIKSFDNTLEIFSAGTNPAFEVHPFAIKVMNEVGIDISNNLPKPVTEFVNQEFDYVITVCDDANENCPVFTGKVKKRLHFGFNDPVKAIGTEEEVLYIFRKIRDEIFNKFKEFYKNEIKLKSIGFVGGGRVAKILINAINNSEISVDKINVSDINSEILNSLKSSYSHVNIFHNEYTETLNSDYIFIALHPPVFLEFLKNNKSLINSSSVIISLAPKIKIDKILECFSDKMKIVRMNPNSPSYIGKGYCPVVFSNDFPLDELKKLNELFTVFGECPEVDEDKLEAFAIITAMGPTYLSFQIYELMNLADSFGLSKNEIKSGISSMLHGLTDLIFESNLIKNEVLDLIPVKPMEQFENEIISNYQNVLTNLYSKLKS